MSYTINPNSVEAFGEMIREQFPEMVSNGTEGAVFQNGDEELVTFMEYGFNVRLSNGASFDVIIKQREYSEESNEFQRGVDGESFECECGNRQHTDGFFPCDEDGELMEPTQAWDGYYRCEQCGKVGV